MDFNKVSELVQAVGEIVRHVEMKNFDSIEQMYREA